MTKRSANVIAISVFAAIVIMMFADVLFLKEPPVVCRQGDLFKIFMPFRDFTFSEIREGRFPFWNPYVFSGVPFFSNIETAVLYPFNWIHMALPAAKAVNMGIVLHLLLGGIFMYIWASSRGLSVFARLLSAVLFVLCFPQFLSGAEGLISNLNTLIWAPLVFLAVDKLFDDRRPRWIFVGAGAVVMQVFAGHAQYLYYTGFIALLYLLIKAARARTSPRPLAKAFAGFVAVYGIAVLLSAVQLIPAVQASSEGVRGGGVSYEFASWFSYPPENFITLLAPGFFGDEIYSPYWGRWAWSGVIYVGISGLALAVCGALWGRRKAKEACVPVIIVCGVIAMGYYTPVFRLLYKYVPGFGMFRGSEKILFLMAMFMTLLSGAGLDWLLGRGKEGAPPEKHYAAKAKSAGVAIYLAATLLLVGAVVIRSPQSGKVTPLWEKHMGNLTEEGRTELVRNFKNNKTYIRDTGLYAWKSLVIASGIAYLFSILFFFAAYRPGLVYAIWLLAMMEVFAFARVYRGNTDTFRDPLPAKVTGFLKAKLEDGRLFGAQALRSNRGMVDKIRFLWGGDGLFPLKRYAELAGYTQGVPPDEAGEYVLFDHYSPVFNMLRCRYIMTKPGIATVAVPVMREKKFDIYENKHGAGRVFLVGRWRILTDRDEIFFAIGSPGFDPLKEVILEETPGIVPSADPGGDVEVMDTGGDNLLVRADIKGSGVLLITDTYARGWRAVDASGRTSRKYKIMPANYVLKGIPLEAGEHVIRIEYLPPGFKTGKIISIVSGAGLLLLGIYNLLAKKRKT